jgi:UDP-N-acetyl-D-glucosamine/UDP-N-acetyl-D-galactosamine dehydrogenase
MAVPKVESGRRGVKLSRRLSNEEMRAVAHAEYFADPKCLTEADIIIAEPTSVDEPHIPNFGTNSASIITEYCLSLRTE